MKPRFIELPAVVILAFILQIQSNLLANDDQLIYSERLNNGWANWGYNATLNFAGTNPVHSGSYSISATMPAWSRIWFVHDPMDVSLYSHFTFWVNGGPVGGQRLQVAASTNGIDGTWVNIGPLPTNSWRQIVVSLGALGVAGSTNLNYLWINNWGGGAQPAFYLDDVLLTADPPPSRVQVGVNALQTIRTVDRRVFGINATAWDGDLDSASTIAVLTNIDNQVLRWPGGSWGDGYHWTNEAWMAGATSARNWGSFSQNFIRVATNTHAQAFIIVNYGTGTPAEAAFGVRMFNATNHCNFKFWEVGNEVGGSWEWDSNTIAPWQPHDPWTYAQRFTDYYNQMKAADSTIKIGAVADTTEDGTSNYSNHPVVNPRTGATHNGWTPVMLTYLRSNNVTPDFLICHDYAPGNGDLNTLLWTRTWADHATGMRQMLNDYLGPSAAPNVELAGTEFGSAGDKQGISLVGGLFYADMIGQILQTEFNSLLWWDLRNGQGTVADSDNALYGWRTNSAGIPLADGGILNGNVTPPDANCYPSYYCMKLMKYFARAGDTVVSATNDYKLLGTYAVRRANGILALLVVNKSSYASLNVTVNLAGYVPSTNATVYAYGIPQDNAAVISTGNLDVSQASAPVAGPNFNYTFPPYSATVLSLTPSAPSLNLPGVPVPAGQFVFQLQGLPGVPYVIQCSPDLANWSSVATNTVSGGTLNVTNAVSPGLPAQFWRAVWQP